MTDLERGWLAGILEGEGCFTTTGKKRPYVCIVMSSTDKDVVDRVAALFGRNTQTLKHKSAISVKQQYRVVIQGAGAVQIIEDVLPLLGDRRRERCEELLAMYRERSG